MFTVTYSSRWKKAILAALITFVGGVVLVTSTPLQSIGFIILLLGPIVSGCVFVVTVFKNMLRKRRHDYVEKKLLPGANDLQMVKEALQNGTAQAFGNENVVVMKDGIFAVTDTVDFYPFSGIDKIYATQQFEGRRVKDMQFIKLESENSHYIAITPRFTVQPSYDLCAKACQEALEKYKEQAE